MFRILKTYSNLWARRHCRVVMSGEENLEGPRDRGRVYIVSHPTTWDLPMLAAISRNNYYIIVDSGPFTYPFVDWLFTGCGFLRLEKDNGDGTVRQAAGLVAAGNPLIVSLKGYGVDFGEKVRPRTGGIRIADMAKSDIYPIHLWIEDGKRIMTASKSSDGKALPYSVFDDTLYFTTFCEPLRWEDWSREDMTYEDYKAIAYGLEQRFDTLESSIRADLAAGRWSGTPRRGGVRKQVRL